MALTVTRMSMTGLAASPGTAVDPMCSIATAASPSDDTRRSRSDSKHPGQDRSYSEITISTGSLPPIKTSSRYSSKSGDESVMTRSYLQRERPRLRECSGRHSEPAGQSRRVRRLPMPCSSDRKNPLTSLSPEQLKLLDQLGEGLTSEAQESLRGRTPPEQW